MLNTNQYLLTTAAAQCSSLAQHIHLALCSGLQDVQSGQTHSNTERISTQVTELLAVLSMLSERGILQLVQDDALIAAKKAQVLKAMEHASNVGAMRRPVHATQPPGLQRRWRDKPNRNPPLKPPLDDRSL